MEERSLRDELLAHDQIDPRLEAELAGRIKDMLETQLHPVHKTAWLISGILGVVNSILLAFLAVKYNNTLPWQATAGFAAGSLFGIAWAAIAYSIVKRGKIIRNRHPLQIAGWVWGLTLMQFIMFSMLAPQAKHHYVATIGMIDSLGFLVIGAVWLISNSIIQSSFKGEEQFLKLQLQLEDINTKLQRLEQGNTGQ